MIGKQPKPANIIAREFRGSRLYLESLHSSNGMRWTNNQRSAMRLEMGAALQVCEHASREWGTTCAVLDSAGNLAQRVPTSKPNCAGSLKWPAYSQSTCVFFCKDCGHVFDRDQLQGRDDHMPAHYPAGHDSGNQV